MIYYLIRPPDIAACEDAITATRYEAQGYERVGAWRFVYYWSLRDDRDYARLRQDDLEDWLLRQDMPAPGERVVGEAEPVPRLRRHRWDRKEQP